jgi:hypothetical protein
MARSIEWPCGIVAAGPESKNSVASQRKAVGARVKKAVSKQRV